MARGLKLHVLSSDCQPSIMGFDKFITRIVFLQKPPDVSPFKESKQVAQRATMLT